MRGFQRGIPDVKVRGSRSGLAGTRGLQASHLAKKTINNGASGALVHRCSGGLVHHCLCALVHCCSGALVHHSSGALVHRWSGALVHHCLWCTNPLVDWCTTALGGGRYCMWLQPAVCALLSFLHCFAFTQCFAFLHYSLGNILK